MLHPGIISRRKKEARVQILVDERVGWDSRKPEVNDIACAGIQRNVSGPVRVCFEDWIASFTVALNNIVSIV
jgi:hypothetical protein